MKKCNRCGLEKPEAFFGPDTRKKSGLQGSCRDCCGRVKEVRTLPQEPPKKREVPEAVKALNVSHPWIQKARSNRNRAAALGYDVTDYDEAVSHATVAALVDLLAMNMTVSELRELQELLDQEL